MKAYKIATLAISTSLLVACAPIKQKTVQQNEAPPACVAAAAGDKLVGNWLTTSSQKGVAGALRTLYTLNADGSMNYVQQIKRGNLPSQGIYESGCWSHSGSDLTIRTYESNGLMVNLQDPIYINKFRILSVDNTYLKIKGSEGEIRAKRMSPGYRLPF